MKKGLKFIGGIVVGVFTAWLLYVFFLFIVKPAFTSVTAQAFQSDMPNTSKVLPEQKKSWDVHLANNMDGADAEIDKVLHDRKMAIGREGGDDVYKLAKDKKDDELIIKSKEAKEKLAKFTDAINYKKDGYENNQISLTAQHIRNGNTETIILPPNFTEKTEIIFHATGSKKTCDQMYVTSQVGTVTAHYISGGEFPLGQGGEYYIMGKSNPLFLTSGPDGATITFKRVPAGK